MNSPRAELELCYLRANYGCRHKDKVFSLAAQDATGWGDMFAASGSQTASWLTADNPGSQLCSPEANQRARKRLRYRLKRTSWRHWPAWSDAVDGHWPREYGLLIFNLELSYAQALAREFGQSAILFGTAANARKNVPCLIWLD